MYIIVDYDDKILFWSDDFQEIDYMLKKKRINNNAAYVYELDFCDMVIKVCKVFDDDDEDDED